MKIRAGYTCSIFLIGYFLLNLTAASSAEIDPYPNIRIPIFKGGYNLQKHFNASKGTSFIRYDLQTDYPPAEVLEFYDAYFNGKGWQSSFEICQRNWEILNKGRKKTVEPLLRRLFASWGHLELNLRALLWITVKMVDKGLRNQVIVECRLQPKGE